MFSDITAPGKLVLCGEYAVLADAPAIVMAVNRRCRVQLQCHEGEQCKFTSAGFVGESIHDITALLSDNVPPEDDPAYLAWHVLAHLRESRELTGALPAFDLHTDSTQMFSQANKLGLGSSASICTGLTAALLELIRNKSLSTSKPDYAPTPGSDNLFALAYQAHRNSQNASGSGLDIAAATFGGLLEFQLSEAAPTIKEIKLPLNLHYQAVFTGQSANTRAGLKKFSEWQSSTNTIELTELCASASEFAETLTNQPADWMSAMAAYITALQKFDLAAQQNIYTPAHFSLHTLAQEHGILYKPCGAGGGDLGLALCDQVEHVQHFKKACEQDGFHCLDLEIDTHGVDTTFV